jgi:hypothetical protein
MFGTKRVLAFAAVVTMVAFAACSDSGGGLLEPVIPAVPEAGVLLSITPGAAQTTTITGASTISITRPAGTAVGDLLLAQITVNGLHSNNGIICAPAGWTSVQENNQGSTITQQIFRKVATADDAAATSFGFVIREQSGSGHPNCTDSNLKNSNAAGGILRYTGVDTGAPVITQSGNTGNNVTNISAPSVDIGTETDAMIVVFFGTQEIRTISLPASTTDRYLVDDHAPSLRAADKVQASSGATGAFNASWTGTTTAVAQTIALKMAPLATTTTTLTATPATSAVVGTSVTFEAEVKQNLTAVTAGTVSFYYGGTSCTVLTGATQIGSATNLDGDGKASVSTSALAIGSYTIRACYSGATGLAASGTSIGYEITRIPTTTVFTLAPTTQQYSDNVNLKAVVSPLTATGSVQFQKSTNGTDFTDHGTAIALGGTQDEAILNGQQITDAAGTLHFRAVFTATGNFANSTGSAVALTVTKEDATVVFAPGNPAAIDVSQLTGTTVPIGELTLTLMVKEKEPDVANAPGTTGIGDVENAGLGVVLHPVASGSVITLDCTAGTTSGTGYARQKSFTCSNDTFIPIGTYEVVATVAGAYYQGSNSDAFTAYVPTTGTTNGGGTVMVGDDRVVFGFSMAFNRGGQRLQGSLIVIRHHADGTRSRLKSNALGGLIVTDESTLYNWASFNGKSTYISWDYGAEEYVTTGNQSFAVYVEDWVAEPDKIRIVGPGTLDITLRALTAGNIKVSP